MPAARLEPSRQELTISDFFTLKYEQTFKNHDISDKCHREKNKNTPKKEFGRKTKEKGKEKQKKRHEENIMGKKTHSQ